MALTSLDQCIALSALSRSPARARWHFLHAGRERRELVLAGVPAVAQRFVQARGRGGLAVIGGTARCCCASSAAGSPVSAAPAPAPHRDACCRRSPADSPA